MKGFFTAFRLAISDYRHESLMSACAILGLAAALAPLMVLMGVHHGVIAAMTDRLLHDPRTLEITPVGSGRYEPRWFRELGSLPEAAFVLPQTRSIAAIMTLRSVSNGASRQTATPVVATDKNDPLLIRWLQPRAAWEQDQTSGTLTASVVLSESLAEKLNVSAGARLEGGVDRVRAGKREFASLPLLVLSVLPSAAAATDMVFVPLELLVATEDYRDGKAVSFLGWTGDAPEAVLPPSFAGDGNAAQIVLDKGGSVNRSGVTDEPAALLSSYARLIREQRAYASFRLYAKTLDDVTPLWQWLRSHNVEVYVKSAEIDTVKNLDRAFSIVFALIAGAFLFGFMASTASNSLAGVRRKSRSLGVMRLLGFTRAGLLVFPLSQSVVTGFSGSALAFALYLAVAWCIDALFASSLSGGEAICSLPPLYVASIVAVVTILSAFSSLLAAWRAIAIEPSEVIRDV